MPPLKVKTHNVRPAKGPKGPANAFSKLSGVGKGTITQEDLEEAFGELTCANTAIETLGAKYDQLRTMLEAGDEVNSAAIWALADSSTVALGCSRPWIDLRVFDIIGSEDARQHLSAELPSLDKEAVESGALASDSDVELMWFEQVLADRKLTEAKIDFLQLVVHKMRLAIPSSTAKRVKQANKAIPGIIDKLSGSVGETLKRNVSLALSVLPPTLEMQTAKKKAEEEALNSSRFLKGMKVFYSANEGQTTQRGTVRTVEDPLSDTSSIIVKFKKKEDKEATPDQVAIFAEKGTRLLYRTKEGDLVEVDVLSVLPEVWPPSYSIKLDDGTEKETEPTRLFSISFRKAFEERTVLASQKNEDVLVRHGAPKNVE